MSHSAADFTPAAASGRAAPPSQYWRPGVAGTVMGEHVGVHAVAYPPAERCMPSLHPSVGHLSRSLTRGMQRLARSLKRDFPMFDVGLSPHPSHVDDGSAPRLLLQHDFTPAAASGRAAPPLQYGHPGVAATMMGEQVGVHAVAYPPAERCRSSLPPSVGHLSSSLTRGMQRLARSLKRDFPMFDVGLSPHPSHVDDGSALRLFQQRGRPVSSSAMATGVRRSARAGALLRKNKRRE